MLHLSTRNMLGITVTKGISSMQGSTTPLKMATTSELLRVVEGMN